MKNEMKGTFRERAALVKLTVTDKTVYDYIMSHGAEMIHMTISEAAERCSVSEATLVRISKKLGYKGFQALKISLAQELVEPLQQFHENLSREDSPGMVARKIFYSHNQSLMDTLGVLDETSLEKAAEAIRNARRVFFVGAGGSGNVASDAINKLLRIGIVSSLFEDYNMQKMLTSIVDKDDVVIGISHSGASISTIDALKLARQRGATCICITNLGRSPIVKYSDICLFTSSQETAYKTEAMSSRIVQLALIDTLVTIISFHDEALYYRNLQLTRKALDETKL